MSAWASDVVSPMTVLDMISKPKILSLSSNRSGGPTAAFTVKKYSVGEDKGTVDIFVNHAETLRSIQYTRNDKGAACSQPILACNLSPGVAEDQVLFLKKGQVYSIPLDGGESIRVTAFPIPVESFKIFVGEDKQVFLALVMNVYSDKSPEETRSHDVTASSTPSTSTGMVFNKLMVRHWDNWGTYEKRHHVFICPLDVNSSGLFEANEAELKDLMLGLDTDCPGKGPGQGEEEYAVSPDGTKLAIACRRPLPTGEQSRDMAWSTDVPIFLIDLDPTSQLRRIISDEDSRAYNSQPLFSQDGKYLAFLSMSRAGYESDRNQIRVVEVATGVTSLLTADIDLSFQSLEWGLNDADTLYTTAQYRGSVRIFRLRLTAPADEATGGALSLCLLEVMTGDESRSNPLLVPYQGDREGITEALYYLESTMHTPSELKIALLSPKDSALFVPFTVVAVNDEITTEGPAAMVTGPSHFTMQVHVPAPEFSNGDIQIPRVTSHYFRGGGGDMVHAWYLPPTTLTDAQLSDPSLAGKVPLVLIVHGGPQGAIINTFSYRWNPCFYAAQGYGVIAVNFHGSTGYGQAFTDSIHGIWGGKPYEDCMAAVDYALSKFPYLDGTHTAALGASYGGYMMNWLNGHTDRFKCLVNHDGIFSLRSLYFATEELFFPEWEFGTPWENPEEYSKWSPDSYVQNWKTPTLVIQGGIDYRVCETESIATFTVLQRRGVPSQMLFFPDENHWVLKAKNSVKWHETVAAWLKQWLIES